jgi:hypothetical protein
MQQQKQHTSEWLFATRGCSSTIESTKAILLRTTIAARSSNQPASLSIARTFVPAAAAISLQV